MRPIRRLGAVFQCTPLFPTPPPVDSLQFCPLVSSHDRLCRLKCLCAFRRVGCEISSGCAVEPGLEGGEKSGQGQPCFEGGEDCLRQAVARPRRAGEGWPDGNRDDAQRLAIMVSSVDRSPLSSRTSGDVTPRHSGAASPESGKASQRSSPAATARTSGAHAGLAQELAVHLAEVSWRATSAAALVSAPWSSPSRWSSSAQAGSRVVVARAGETVVAGKLRRDRVQAVAD